jgi:hypothetical protein
MAEIGQVVTEFASLVNPDNITKILTNTDQRHFFLTRT